MNLEYVIDRMTAFSRKVAYWATNGHKPGQIDNELNTLSVREYKELKWLQREINRAINEFEATMD